MCCVATDDTLQTGPAGFSQRSICWPSSIIVCTSSGFTPDRSTAALPSSTAETSTKAPQKAAERRPDAASEADFLEHCFIAKGVLIGSSNYFTAGPKRSTSSFHEAMILAFVFRAL